MQYSHGLGLECYNTSSKPYVYYIIMNCPICQAKVLNNSDYSVHMNKTHRGKSYKPLNNGEGIKKHESNNRKSSKTNVDSRLG